MEKTSTWKAFKKKLENLIRTKGQLGWHPYLPYVSVKKIKEMTDV